MVLSKIGDHSRKMSYSLTVLVNLGQHLSEMKPALVKILVNNQNLEVHLNSFLAVIEEVFPKEYSQGFAILSMLCPVF
jgi:hypothetical protein